MMSGAYMIFEIDVHDEQTYEEYRTVGGALMEQAGGRAVAGLKRREVLTDGPLPQKLSVIEFESFEAAKAFYDSPEYQAISPVREASSTSRVYLLEKE